MSQRVCIIGLDCLTPQLLFDEFLENLPHLRHLMDHAIWGPLRSCVPPITVPAWACMVTGVDPGGLGVYGFHGRCGWDPSKRQLASSMSFDPPPLWTHISRAQIGCRVLGVPQTYPAKPIRGAMLTGCLTPQNGAYATYPKELAKDIHQRVGEFTFDIADFRTQNLDALKLAIEQMTAQRFALAKHWMLQNDWQFFMMVDMGPDRMHHRFWRFNAKDHPQFDPKNKMRHVLADYYQKLDAHLGALLGVLRSDDIVMVVSDHGAKTMHGSVAINQWLMQRGDLHLRKTLTQGETPKPCDIDWDTTRAFADGGYVGRIYFNITGREPNGCLDASRVDDFAESMRRDLCALSDNTGTSWDTRVHRPHEIYQTVRGSAPDLTVVFDDLRRRAIGSVGYPNVHVQGNDQGIDDANHGMDGVCIMRDGQQTGHRKGMTLYDIAPTVLHQLELPIPEYMLGNVLSFIDRD